MKNEKATKYPELKRKTASSNAARDYSSPGLGVTNGPPGFCKRPNGMTAYAPKHQTKRHFSICRDIWIVQQLSQEVSHQVLRLGRLSIIPQIGIPLTHWNIGRRSAPQLVKDTLHLGVPGYAFEYNARLTHQAIQRAVHIYTKRSPARFLGILSLAVSFGSLGCVY